MNKDIMEQFGFWKEVAQIEAGVCPFCATEGPFEFRDALSVKEFRISGLCQKYQDEIFTSPEEEYDPLFDDSEWAF